MLIGSKDVAHQRPTGNRNKTPPGETGERAEMSPRTGMGSKDRKGLPLSLELTALDRDLHFLRDIVGV